MKDRPKPRIRGFGDNRLRTTDGAVAGIMKLRIYVITEATPDYRLQDNESTRQLVGRQPLVD